MSAGRKKLEVGTVQAHQNHRPNANPTAAMMSTAVKTMSNSMKLEVRSWKLEVGS
jgi:hypothetical protein